MPRRDENILIEIVVKITEKCAPPDIQSLKRINAGLSTGLEEDVVALISVKRKRLALVVRHPDVRQSVPIKVGHIATHAAFA